MRGRRARVHVVHLLKSSLRLDALAAASSKESNPNEQVHHIPLHRQFIPWAARSNVSVVHRADNWLEVQWVTVAAK